MNLYTNLFILLLFIYFSLFIAFRSALEFNMIDVLRGRCNHIHNIIYKVDVSIYIYIYTHAQTYTHI
jgi:hypothetical protein